MSTLEVDGLSIAYTVEGAGPPLVMLHGATSSALEDWAAQRPLFRRAFRLYLPDARGHGATRWDAAAGFSGEMLVADLEGFVDALGLATFHLAGFSMGALTALAYAARHPRRLRTLLVVGADVEREPRSSVARRLMDPARIEAEEPAWAAQLERRHGPVQGPGAWRVLLAAIAADVAAQPPVSPAELRRIRVPTLLVCGDRDVFVPPDHAVALYRQLPDARLFVVPDTDHQAMVSRPGLFNDAAGLFYRSTEAIARARAAGDAAVPPAARGVKRDPLPGVLAARPPDLDEIRAFDPLWDERADRAEPDPGTEA